MKNYKTILSHCIARTFQKNVFDLRDKDLHNTMHVQSTAQTLFTNVSNKKVKKTYA